MGFKIPKLNGMLVYVRWVKDEKASAAEYAFKINKDGDMPTVGNLYAVRGENSGTVVVTRLGAGRRDEDSGRLQVTREDGTKFNITKQMMFNQKESTATATKYTGRFTL
jgi:hypothetical protein